MSEAQAGPKPKKSVALSGIAAGSTALCTVGRSGNDLHYRGYDILDIAEQCEFEEIAHLLIHEKLPTRAELAAYKGRLRSLRGLPASSIAAAQSSVGAALAIGEKIGGTQGAAITSAAKHSFINAMDRGLVVGAGIALLGALVALIWLPNRAAETDAIELNVRRHDGELATVTERAE